MISVGLSLHSYYYRHLLFSSSVNEKFLFIILLMSLFKVFVNDTLRKFSTIVWGIKISEAVVRRCNFIKRVSVTSVFLCVLRNSKNTFFTEHLRTTASKILCFISCSSSCTVTMRLDLLLHLLCEETLPHHAVAFSILTGVLHTARKNACSKVCKSVITTFAVMIFLCEREAA